MRIESLIDTLEDIASRGIARRSVVLITWSFAGMPASYNDVRFLVGKYLDIPQPLLAPFSKFPCSSFCFHLSGCLAAQHIKVIIWLLTAALPRVYI
jgi:hypothetical protein